MIGPIGRIRLIGPIDDAENGGYRSPPRQLPKNMNATLKTTNPRPNAGTDAIISPFLEELWETYLFAGLPFDTAMAAAIADYADLFLDAA